MVEADRVADLVAPQSLLVRVCVLMVVRDRPRIAAICVDTQGLDSLRASGPRLGAPERA